MGNVRKKYKSVIGEKLNLEPENVTLFWKGRVALYAILKAMGIKEGDEVILPAFTCVVVPNVIIYHKAKPVYVDIKPDTFTPDPEKIKEKITPETKFIIVQNTFGLSADLDKILKLANKYNIQVIDDCTHGFGGYYKGKPNGTIAKASFFSTQWNKPYSTGIGGFAVTNDTELAKKLNSIEKQALSPGFKEVTFLSLLLFAHKNFLNNSTYWILLHAYRSLSKMNLIVGSSQGYELERPLIPGDFLKKMSGVQAEKGLKALKTFDAGIKHRKSTAEKYIGMLKEVNIEFPDIPDNNDHIFLKFPLLVKDRDQFMKEAENNKIEIGDWFLSPIHPVKEDFEKWDYHYGQNPVAEKIARHIVNLPTHSGISEKEFNRIKDFIQKQEENILHYK